MNIESIRIAENNVQHSAASGAPAAKATQQSEGSRKAEPRSPDLAEIRTVTADMQEDIEMIYNVKLDFSVDQSTGEVMVTVSEKESGEVIREIPPAEMLKLAAKMDEMVGLLLDRSI